jgi:hypothetical protein
VIRARAALLLLALVALTATASAQPAARVIASYADGSHKVVVGNDTLWAITTKMAKQFADSMSLLARLRGEATARDTLIGQLRTTVMRADTTVAKYNAYTTVLQQQADGYKHLADLVERHHARGSRLALELGGGLTGGDPAVIAGLSVYRVRLWTFLQRDNAGGMLGASLPIW